MILISVGATITPRGYSITPGKASYFERHLQGVYFHIIYNLGSHLVEGQKISDNKHNTKKTTRGMHLDQDISNVLRVWPNNV